MNGFLFIRRKGIITGPFPFRRVQELLQKGMLNLEDEVSGDKLNWSSVTWYFRDGTSEEKSTPVPASASLPEAESGVPETVDFPEEVVSDWEWQKKEEAATFAPQQPDTRSHLWPFCHLVCAMTAWNAHARALERRCDAVVWSALAYAVLADFGATMLFCRAYPALHGYLWSAVYAAGALATGVSVAFLCGGVAVRVRHTAWNRRIVTTAAMTLLVHFATLFGTMLMLLHGVRHPQVWGRCVALLAQLLAVGAFSAGSRQILLGVVCPNGGISHRHGALWAWALWLFLIFLGFSFFSLFALGLL